MHPFIVDMIENFGCATFRPFLLTFQMLKMRMWHGNIEVSLHFYLFFTSEYLPSGYSVSSTLNTVYRSFARLFLCSVLVNVHVAWTLSALQHIFNDKRLLTSVLDDVNPNNGSNTHLPVELLNSG